MLYAYIRIFDVMNTVAKFLGTKYGLNLDREDDGNTHAVTHGTISKSNQEKNTTQPHAAETALLHLTCWSQLDAVHVPVESCCYRRLVVVLTKPVGTTPV